MLLNNRARELMENYTAGVAQHFGAKDPGRYFSLNDPQENALRQAMLESVEFLDWITALDVDQLDLVPRTHIYCWIAGSRLNPLLKRLMTTSTRKAITVTVMICSVLRCRKPDTI